MSILEKNTFTDQSHELNIATITDHFFQSWNRIPPNSREVLIGALVDYAEKITPIGYMTGGSQLQQKKIKTTFKSYEKNDWAGISTGKNKH